MAWTAISHPALTAEEAVAVQERLHQIFLAWEGTPFQDNMQIRGRGVDCVRFMAAVLNEAYREQRCTINQLPRDVGWHDRSRAIQAMRAIHRIYPESAIIRDGSLEPGDVLVTRPPGGGPAHVVMVGGRPGHFWEASSGGVVRCGQPAKIARTYRATDKNLWFN